MAYVCWVFFDAWGPIQLGRLYWLLGCLIGRLLPRVYLADIGIPPERMVFSATSAGKPYLVSFPLYMELTLLFISSRGSGFPHSGSAFRIQHQPRRRFRLHGHAKFKRPRGSYWSGHYEGRTRSRTDRCGFRSRYGGLCESSQNASRLHLGESLRNPLISSSPLENESTSHLTSPKHPQPTKPSKPYPSTGL